MPRLRATDSCHRVVFQASNSKVNIIKQEQKAQQCCVRIKKTDGKKEKKISCEIWVEQLLLQKQLGMARAFLIYTRESLTYTSKKSTTEHNEE